LLAISDPYTALCVDECVLIAGLHPDPKDETKQTVLRGA
jgi:hypothetical protein